MVMVPTTMYALKIISKKNRDYFDFCHNGKNIVDFAM